MIDLLRQTHTYQSLVENLRAQFSPSKGDTSDRPIAYPKPWLRGLHGASISYLLGTLLADFADKSFLIVLPSQHEAEKIIQDLPTYRFEDARLFPEWQHFLYDGISPTKKVVAERMVCLDPLLKKKRTVIITSIQALMHKLLPKSILSSAFLTLHVGDEIDPDEVVEQLLRVGYQRVDLVEVKGEFARRGDILDVYPLTADAPIRVEFFGDEIDAIRLFDPASQRSVSDGIDETPDSITLSPVREIILSPEALAQWKIRSEELMQVNASPKYRNAIHEITQRLESGTDPEGLEALLPLLYADASTDSVEHPETQNLLTDYLAPQTAVLLIEPVWMARAGSQIIENGRALYERKLAFDQFMVSPDETFVPFESVISTLQHYPLVRTSLTPATAKPDEEIEEMDFNMRPLGLPRGKYQMVIDQIKEWTDEGYFVNIFCDNLKGADRLNEILTDRDLPATQTAVNVGSISEGFLSEALKLVALAEDEMFGREHRRHHKTNFKEGAPILSLIDLQEGDYVVHVSHGIGLYSGIRRLDIDGKLQDFLVLEYAAGDRLYVPTYQIDLVQKYIGGKEDGKLRLDKLGGTSWQRTKAKVKASIERMAEELLELYAIRESREGHAFPSDALWQWEFDALFPYDETPDQLKAIDEVKTDMERSRPMDRLICGDVGYGKTEVALRAAFKTVMDGRQVAILAPTTILTLQHFNTFQQRFDTFPVQVEMLNRFRTDKEAKLVKEGLANGKVDIVIGTHSLLSNSTKFHDLGLLVVDEEHRFGVKHKERIKHMKQTVDVLTLTATPIPRTLHMSLIGIRDFSVINTPPENRMPIETYVMEYNTDVVRDAILREMDRGGQVFFVHNRVQSIASIATAVQDLVPQARIGTAHGQLPERQLEQVMMDFINYKYDVLVCTMIIESGLDIPNVNTILINRADALGLAQLYQLRGRVGRAQFQAYGYLFYPQGRAITEGAQKRLRIIEEFTDLGSGFKIALRDLEIRGTGNILGPEQHGQIAAVGYDMYCKLLEEAVHKLKGEEVEETIETRINLPIEAYLPDAYVPDSRQKVALYKKIADLKTEVDRKELEEEMKDRYGKIPQPVQMLLEIADLKQLSQRLGIDGIVAGEDNVKVAFDETKTSVDPQKLIQFIRQDRRITLSPPARLTINTKGLEGKTLLLTLRRILSRLM
ncbi:MAG: transcription-repair coupling factor [Candidatus Poribacteria bacterium]|nr:transcription-repair coupling factor [Candidatus Poribacteria bacterium]